MCLRQDANWIPTWKRQRYKSWRKYQNIMLSGIIALNKPVGLKSSACVNIVKQFLGKKTKVGHAGTLDAPAGGLLLLVIGSATRLSRYIMELPKIYEVTITLGCFTDTDDYTGNIIESYAIKSEKRLLERLESAIFSFQGVRMQTPPNISAVKVGGKRAHKLSREGKIVDIKPRPILVTQINPIDSSNFPDLSYRVSCHKGTYIRSIARDIGTLLQCGAFVSSLTRVKTGPFSINSSKCIQDLNTLDYDSLIDHIQPVDSFLGDFTTYKIATAVALDCAKHGRAIPLNELQRSGWGVIPSSCAVGLTGNELLSMGRIFEECHKLYVKPTTNIFGSDKI